MQVIHRYYSDWLTVSKVNQAVSCAKISIMRVYLAYKYRCVDNKDQLIQDLNRISDTIEKSGHSTFILGRDVQKWGSASSSLFTSIPTILKNLVKSDLVFAFIDNCAKSQGLPFEIFCAKLLGKKIIYAVRNEVDFKVVEQEVVNKVSYGNLDELLGRVPALLG